MCGKPIILRQALEKGISILKSAGIEAPVTDAGVMLCKVLNCEKTYLYSHDEHILSRQEEASYFELVGKRAGGIPLQYITGHQEFMSLDFSVSTSVLIPRHDTEALVEEVMLHANELSTTDGEISILDIGTGSGCIAVSLAYYIKDCTVTAVDISEKALEMARLNAVKLGVYGKTVFRLSDLFENVEKRNYDIIVSNPPYIPKEEIAGLNRQVKAYEPLTALDGGPDGLSYYRYIIKNSADFLKPEGLLAFEVGYNQAANVQDMMNGSFHNIKIIKDLSGIDRVVTGRL